MIIDDTTPIAALTVAELKKVILSMRDTEATEQIQNMSGQPRFVYGLQGIEELFNCSRATAQKYKNTIISEAVIQNGRKIVVDVEKAISLFNQNKMLL